MGINDKYHIGKPKAKERSWEQHKGEGLRFRLLGREVSWLMDRVFFKENLEAFLGKGRASSEEFSIHEK